MKIPFPPIRTWSDVEDVVSLGAIVMLGLAAFLIVVMILIGFIIAMVNAV